MPTLTDEEIQVIIGALSDKHAIGWLSHEGYGRIVEKLIAMLPAQPHLPHSTPTQDPS